MSFDVFLQQFVDGDAGPGGNVEARAVLEPYLVRDADATITGLRTDDGEAEIYGLDDDKSGFMVTHASGDQVWDLLVSAARAGGLVVMPVGCPVCATNAELLTHLPEELAGDTRVVANGAELLHAITTA